MALRVSLFILMLAACALPGVVRAEEAEYRLAAQDKFTVSVLKHEELSQTYTVPPDGTIDFPRAGRITVLGKTTAEVAAALREQYGKFLRDPEVTVTLTDPRVKSAYVLGSVARPGQYPLTAGARITELLAAAGDVVGERKDLTASLMRGSTQMPVDLQAVLDGNDPAANIAIQEGDVLWIQPPPRITVVVSGQVKNPGMLKLREGSKLVDALAQAGDLTDRPDRMKITLLRGGVPEVVAWGDASKVLLDGDVILVERENVARVYVDGHVKTPGAYELPDGGGVLEAIALAGGVRERPALGQVTIVRAKTGATERVDLSRALRQGIVEQNPRLANGDQVIVPESTATVTVLGSVRTPSTLPYDESRTVTVVDAIGMAGGQDKKAKLSEVAVIRVVDGKAVRIPVNVDDILKHGKQELNIALRPGDVVFVPESGRLDWSQIMQGLSTIGILAGAAL